MYHISAQPTDRVRVQLKRLGVPNIDNLENVVPTDSPTLALNDWYTAAIGRKEEDQFVEEHKVYNSLKVADLSIVWMEGERKYGDLYEKPGPPVLRIHDNISCLSRFNDEKAWVEFVIRRIIPRATRWNQVALIGLTEGLHSDSVYKTLEGLADGVIDFKLKETPDEIKDLVRIRSMRSVGFDRAWHPLRMSENTEITLEG